MIAFAVKQRMVTGVWVLAGALLALVVGWSGAAPAAAEFGFAPGSFQTVSSSVQAGGHPDFTTSFEVNSHEGPLGLEPDADPRDIVVKLPPGLSGNPENYPKCTTARLGVHECPPETQVGYVVLGLSNSGVYTLISAPVYNLVPQNHHVAEFGFIAIGPQIHVAISVRTGSDYGVDATITDIPALMPLISSKLTLWGDPADPVHDPERSSGSATSFGVSLPGAELRPFMRNPTSCGVASAASITMDSWEHPGVYLPEVAATPRTMVGCEALSFHPSISVAPQSRRAGVPSGYSVDVHEPQPEGATAVSSPDLKDATVALPAGVVVNPSQADGLQACSPAQIGLDNDSPVACPDASKVGSVEVDTPVLPEPLHGYVYVAQQGNLAGWGSNPFGSLLALYVVAEGQGAIVKLAGKVALDPVTGQLVTTFLNNPQLPSSDFKLDFFGGPHAALINPASCGTYQSNASFTPWSGGAAVAVSSSFQIDEGCGAEGFSPSFVAGSTSSQAGGFSPFTLTLSRGETEQALGSVSVTMPPGLLGMLRSVTQCPEPQASQGACPASSQIGSSTVGAGAGPSPVFVPQPGDPANPVFLTGPYEGAPFGLAVVTHAKVGPFDLGSVVVRARILVDPHTAQITVVSDPLPTILQGVPLDLRVVNVKVDRPGFMFNPTSCRQLGVAGTITSTQGTAAGVSSAFRAVNCASLPFHPTFKVSTQARTSRKAGASLDVKVGSGAGQANIGRVVVSLPRQLPSWLPTLQKACVDRVFDANPAGCPAASLVGSATASTPVLAHALTGPAYLVSHGGAAFPDLVVVLQGEGITLQLDGQTSIKGQVTTSTFASVPDAPIGSFELKLPEGPNHVLAAVLPAKAKGSLCGQKLTMPTAITGQNGAVVKQATKISVAGCASAKKKAKHKPRKHTKRKRKG